MFSIEDLVNILTPTMERYGWSFEKAFSVVVVNQWFFCFVFGGLTVFLVDRRKNIVRLVRSAIRFLRRR